MVPLLANSATNSATTASFADVSSAYTAASRGDTVLIPAGAADWAGNTLTVSKGVALVGAGRTSTLIKSTAAAIAIAPDATALASGEAFRVFALSINGSGTAVNCITVAGAGYSDTKALTNFAIGNCMFTNLANTTSGAGAISTTKQVRGVIYSNIFDCCNVILKVMGNDATNEWSNGNWPRTLGTVDNLYFEGNTIQYSRAYSGPDSGWTETGQGSRLCMRYNTWNLANGDHTELWDVHGFQNWGGWGQTGTMLSEYYGNTITGLTAGRWLTIRGGWAMIFNNVCTGSGGAGIEINQYAAGDSGGSGCNTNIPTWASGMYDGLVTNCYVWNNTDDGVIEPMVQGPIGDGCGTAENQNWWNYNSSFNGTVGIGRGTASPTDTPSLNVGYWKCSTATPTTDPAIVQTGRFYKAVTAGSWTDYYQPFTFPHPIVSAQDGGGGDVTAPTCVITSPASVSSGGSGSYSTSSSTITVSGTSDDATATITWSNSRGGAGTCSGSSSWSKSGITLASGGNVLTFVATDPSANATTTTLNVTYTAPPPSSGTTNNVRNLRIGRWQSPFLGVQYLQTQNPAAQRTLMSSVPASYVNLPIRYSILTGGAYGGYANGTNYYDAQYALNTNSGWNMVLQFSDMPTNLIATYVPYLVARYPAWMVVPINENDSAAESSDTIKLYRAALPSQRLGGPALYHIVNPPYIDALVASNAFQLLDSFIAHDYLAVPLNGLCTDGWWTNTYYHPSNTPTGYHPEWSVGNLPSRLAWMNGYTNQLRTNFTDTPKAMVTEYGIYQNDVPDGDYAGRTFRAMNIPVFVTANYAGTNSCPYNNALYDANGVGYFTTSQRAFLNAIQE